MESRQMDEAKMAHPLCPFRCGNRLTDETSSKEHVILNSIGGRKRVTGFICNSCNSRTGAIWDAELARQLNPLSLVLGIDRQSGEVPSQAFPTSSGGEVKLHPGGRMTIAKPSHEVTIDGTNTQIRIHARTMREMRSLVDGMRRKYPRLQTRTLDDLMSTAKPAMHYKSDWIGINLDFGGKDAGRSVVKSAVALTYDAGIDPNGCDIALNYLLNEAAEPCFGYFYDIDRDLVINRPVGKPFHCVCVKGDPGTETILGYIELYSLHRMVLCLSESYLGRPFTHVYAIDPIKGEEVDLDIDLDLSISDVRSAYRYEKIYERVRRSSVESLMEYIIDNRLDQIS